MRKSDEGQYKVRMPKALHRRLMREANRHGHTLNSEILQRLEASFAAEDQGAFTEKLLKVAENQSRNVIQEEARKAFQEHAEAYFKLMEKARAKWQQSEPKATEGDDDGASKEAR
jgi:hypothetical protein